MKVVSTERSQVLSGKIAVTLGIDIVDTVFSRFPDGEIYIRTGDLDDEMIIVGSVTDCDSFLQLLLLIDACEDSANTLVVPYMGYARQDRKFKQGEPVSARVLCRALGRGVDSVYTVNVHKEAILEFFGVPAKNLSLARDIGIFVRSLGIENPLILAPDAGAAPFAEAVAAVGGWDLDELKKTRLSGDEVRMEPKNLDVSGREVVIVDDIISTGGTLATAAAMLKEQQAKKIHAICVHGVFSGGAYARLRHAGLQTIVASDTIESAGSMISAAATISTVFMKR